MTTIPTVTVPNGTYQAKLTNYGIWENTKTGKLSAFIDVSIDVGGNTQRMRWFGGISDVVASGKNRSPKDWTVSTFEKLNSTFTWSDLVTKATKDQDKHKLVGMDVSVVVVNENNPKTNQMAPRVRYINPANGKFKALSPKALASLGPKQDTFSDFNESDIPF